METLERKIHDTLVEHCGSATAVKGISSTSLSKLKNGKSGISTRKLKDILILNGITGQLVLSVNGNKVTIDLY